VGDVGEILDEARTEFPAPPRPKEPCHNKENTLEPGIANPKMKLEGNEHTPLRGVGGCFLGLGLGGEAVRVSLILGKRNLFPEATEPSASDSSILALAASEDDTME